MFLLPIFDPQSRSRPGLASHATGGKIGFRVTLDDGAPTLADDAHLEYWER